MAMSTFQKVTLATCLVLCVALLLPKMLLSRRKDAERPDGAGRFPPGMHRQGAPEGRGKKVSGSGFSRAQNSEATPRTKGAGPGPGTGGKSNLAGQIIPVYGFGILLYILYILFKIMSKGSSQAADSRFPPVRSENKKRKITDFELAQLQDKLRETELVMEKIVSTAHHSPDRVKGVSPDQEENLLQQLTEITRVMQEGQLVEGGVPNKTPKDWDGVPEASPPYWETCCCQHHPERTEGDETSRGDDPAEDVPVGDLRTEPVTVASDEDVSPGKDPGTRDTGYDYEEGGGPAGLDVPEDEHEEGGGPAGPDVPEDEHEEGGGPAGPDVPEDEHEEGGGPAGPDVPEDEDTAPLEQEKTTPPAETETSSSSVRRRSRRKTKKRQH
ncbi:protein RIC-3b [Cololabis saira]|uniref:protein RIC-3b n=1 Tax=Cololabis saira TaxID=129043 RepID=UPI002AD54D86|nr:protein RIC-3b [Cololabis saira]